MAAHHHSRQNFLREIYEDPYDWLIIGLGIFWTTTLLASAFRFSEFETNILLRVNHLPNSLKGIFLVITQLGSAWIIVLIPIFFWLKSKGRAELQVVLSGFVAYVLVSLAKLLVGRPRPEMVIPTISVRELSASGMGFPSGHTALATAVGLTLLPILRGRWKLVVPLWIVLVMTSRLYLGVHAPLDVIGGLGVGIFSAGLLKAFYQLPKSHKAALKRAYRKIGSKSKRLDVNNKKA